MKIAVTGASGFVGQHVLQALASRPGVEVFALTRSPMSAPALPIGARHELLDITKKSAEVFERIGMPDVLIHLAWQGLPHYKSLHHFETELGVQYRFLSGLIRAGLPQLLCTGTCFEYGLQSGELNEQRTTDPRNPYGYAKDSLRRQLEMLRDSVPFNLTWARLFYTYGEGQPGSSLYSQWAAAHARGDAEFPMSGGEQLRDFLPVREVAYLIVALALDARCFETINVCSGTPVSVRSLVERWMQEAGSSMRLDLGRYPYPDYEPMAFWGSTARLHSVLQTNADFN